MMIPHRKVTNITRYVETEAPIIELGEIHSIVRLAFGASFQDFTNFVLRISENPTTKTSTTPTAMAPASTKSIG